MKGTLSKRWRTAAAAVFWLAVWQLASSAISNEILFASPLETAGALISLAGRQTFWISIAMSFLRITAGFVMALTAGALLAAAAYFVRLAGVLLTPLMNLIKAIPVASFTILLLIWISSGSLPLAVSFIMVLPVIYINVLQGLEGTDVKLLEMASVFRMGWRKRLRYIYLPAVLPHLIAACSIGLGFSWKSGIAAEVIGLSADSIGRQLYDAKLYLMTPELFAWTAVIVIISVCFERAVMFLIKKGAAAMLKT